MEDLTAIVKDLHRAVIAVNEKDEAPEPVDHDSAFTAFHLAKHIEYHNARDVLTGCICLNLLNTYVKQDGHLIGYGFKHYIVRLMDYLTEIDDPDVRFSLYKDQNMPFLVIMVAGIHQFSFHNVEKHEGLQKRSDETEQQYGELRWDGVRNQRAAMTLYAYLPQIIPHCSDPEIFTKAAEYAAEDDRRTA